MMVGTTQGIIMALRMNRANFTLEFRISASAMPRMNWASTTPITNAKVFSTAGSILPPVNSLR